MVLKIYNPIFFTLIDNNRTMNTVNTIIFQIVWKSVTKKGVYK